MVQIGIKKQILTVLFQIIKMPKVSALTKREKFFLAKVLFFGKNIMPTTIFPFFFSLCFC
jgi:hypothetical protein